MAYNMNKKNNMYQNPYYSSINPNTGFSTGNTPNDIWYNLGALAGAIWGNNYNERGIAKGTNTANAILNGEGTVGVGGSSVNIPNIDALYAGADMANAIGSNGYVDQQQQAGPITAAVGAQQQQQPTNAIGAGDQQQQMTAGPITMATGAGQIQQSPSAIPQQNTVSIGGTQIADGNFPQPRTALMNGYANSDSNVPKASSGQTAPTGNMVNDMGSVAAGQQMGVTATMPRDLGAEKLDYIAGKYSSSDNPDGDRAAIRATTDKLQTNITLGNLGVNASTDPEMYKAAIRAQLLKDGRTPYQIEQIMSAVNPTINSKVNSAKEQQFMNLYELYKKQVQAGEIDNSALTYAKMKALNPIWAEGLSGQFKRNQSDFLENYEVEQKIKRYVDAGMPRDRARNLAVFGTYYSPAEQAQMGVFTSTVGGGTRRSGGYSRGSYGGGGGGRTTIGRSSGGVNTGKSNYGTWNGIAYGSDKHKAIQAEYDALTSAENLTPAQRKRISDLGYVLEQINNSITSVVPPSREERIASAKHMLDNGILPDQMLQGLDPSSLEYAELSAVINEAASQREQDAAERNAENARSKAESQKLAAQAQEQERVRAQEAYDAEHRHGFIAEVDKAGGLLPWVQGKVQGLIGR